MQIITWTLYYWDTTHSVVQCHPARFSDSLRRQLISSSIAYWRPLIKRRVHEVFGVPFRLYAHVGLNTQGNRGHVLPVFGRCEAGNYSQRLNASLQINIGSDCRGVQENTMLCFISERKTVKMGSLFRHRSFLVGSHFCMFCQTTSAWSCVQESFKSFVRIVPI